MRYSLEVFIGFAIADLFLAGWRHGARGVLLCAGALACIASLLWFGDLWNIMFRVGVASVKHPVVTRETPNAVLAVAGLILLVVLTFLLL